MNPQTNPEGKDGAESMHGWQFDDELIKTWRNNVSGFERVNFIEYLIERCRRTESELTRLREELRHKGEALKIGGELLRQRRLDAEAKLLTVEELRAEFERPRIKAMQKHTPLPTMPRRDDGSYVFDESNHAWYWFLEAARLLGRVKE